MKTINIVKVTSGNNLNKLELWVDSMSAELRRDYLNSRLGTEAVAIKIKQDIEDATYLEELAGYPVYPKLELSEKNRLFSFTLHLSKDFWISGHVKVSSTGKFIRFEKWMWCERFKAEGTYETMHKFKPSDHSLAQIEELLIFNLDDSTK